MKVYLYDIESDYELQDEELNFEQARTEFYELSDEEGSFFGIKAPKESIQFAWEKDAMWLVDVPTDMANMLCLQKYATYEECIEIIESIFSGISPKDIGGLVQLNIMTEDLNEILKRNQHFPGYYARDKNGTQYDNSRWHIANDFPEDLPKEAALTHMGMFMGWVLDKGFESDSIKEDFRENIKKFRDREITGAKFLELSCDSKLSPENLDEEANKFSSFYYSSGSYFNDYSTVLYTGEATVFHIPYSWENYGLVKKIIEERYEEWSFRD